MTEELKSSYGIMSEDKHTINSWLEDKTENTIAPAERMSPWAISTHNEYLQELSRVTFINLAYKARFDTDAHKLFITIEKYFHLHHFCTAIYSCGQRINTDPDAVRMYCGVVDYKMTQLFDDTASGVFWGTYLTKQQFREDDLIRGYILEVWRDFKKDRHFACPDEQWIGLLTLTSLIAKALLLKELKQLVAL